MVAGIELEKYAADREMLNQQSKKQSFPEWQSTGTNQNGGYPKVVILAELQD